MLTEKEREWLDERKVYPLNGCVTCKYKWYIYDHPCQWEISGICPYFNVLKKPSKDALRDALEFSERVAAKLAIMMYHLAANSLSRDFSCEKSCVAHLVCQKDKSCVHSFMKYARIAVEEEMGC